MCHRFLWEKPKFSVWFAPWLRERGARRDRPASVNRARRAHGRKGYAFQRLVWARAQTAMDNPCIWSAVSEIAEWLAERIDLDDDSPADQVATMYGATARAIMGRCGVTPGMRFLGGSGRDQRLFLARPMAMNVAPYVGSTKKVRWVITR